MRIIRTILFIGAIAILMPSPPQEENGRASLMSSARQVSTPEVIYAASRAVSDVGDFCGRQPVVCNTAGFIATKLEAKAKYSAKLIYEWANEASSPPGAEEAFEVEHLATGSLPKVAGFGGEQSQSTLKVEDLIPDWRDPLPQKG